MTICADGDRRDASKEDADDMTSKILVPSSAVVDAEGSITPKQNEWEQGNHAMVPENTPQTSSQQESEEMTPTATNELRPKVGFSVLTLREYPIVLGDNPGGSGGPPLSIDWNHVRETKISVDAYESERPGRRQRMEMVIPCSDRMQLLKRVGYTRREIVDGTKPVNIVRHQRSRTRETQGLQPISEAVESISRKAKNLLSFGARKRNERKFLEMADSFSNKVALSGSSVELTEKTSVDSCDVEV